MRASLVAQLVKNLPAMQNTLVWLIYYLISCWLDTKCSLKIPTIYHYKEYIKSKLFKSVKDSESIKINYYTRKYPSIFKIYKTWSLIFSQLNNHPKSLNDIPKNVFSSAQLCLILCDSMDCSMPGFPVDHQLPEFTQTHVHWVSDAIQPSQPLSFPSPLACSLSQHQGLFKQVSSSHRWPKYWSFSFSISPSNEYSVLISLRMDWLDLLAVQGTQESSPSPQFKSINSLALSFLYSPTLTSIPDYWKNHSFY